MRFDRNKRKTLICFILLLACVAMLVTSILHLSDLPLHKITGAFKSATENRNEMNAVTIDGRRYLPRENQSVYLLIGIDKDGEMKKSEGYINHEQSDFLTLLIFDHAARTYSLMSINRDTIADVPQLGVFGDKVGVKREQLALAHTYGNGMENSCRNTVDAVSGFLYGAKIDSYFCITMSALPIINDYFGGVEITFDKDYTELDPAFVDGSTLRLSGEQAYNFIRARASAAEPTNIARMGRQRLYMEAAIGQLEGKTSASALLDVLTRVSPYLLTNYDISGTETMSRILRDYTFMGSFTPAGESKIEDGYMAFYADEEALKDYVTKTFYEKYD